MDNNGNRKDKLSMDMAYEDVLERLKEERLIHRLSQEDLSHQLKMTQGHYSKAEHAIKRFTYYEVKSLADSELDLYYIYTGRRIVHKHGEILKNCGYRELLCYLHVLLSLACCRYGEQRREAEAKRYHQLSRLKYITGAVDGQDSIFMLIRKYERQTQFEMADRLGMDIKRYRGVEKGASLPDSELLFKVYSLFDISPAYVLKDRKGLSCEIEYYLNRVDPESNGTIYRYFRLMRELYVSRKVKKDVPQGGTQGTQGRLREP